MNTRTELPLSLSWEWLGRVDYRTGLEHQRGLRDRLIAGDESAARLVLCEHEPVITLGKGAGQDPKRHLLVPPEVLAARGIELCRVDRGGDITYHGPGQLMVYPVVRLGGSLLAMLEAVAQALSEVADRLGVSGAEWRRNPAGLWLGSAKLAACGVHLRRWVCTHGFAFNVSTPPGMWESIVPCGLPTARVTSLLQECEHRGLPPPPPVADVARAAAPVLCRALAAQHRRME